MATATPRRGSAEEAMPKKSICPSTFWRRLAAMASMSFSLTEASWLRRPPKRSKAPA